MSELETVWNGSKDGLWWGSDTVKTCGQLITVPNAIVPAPKLPNAATKWVWSSTDAVAQATSLEWQTPATISAIAGCSARLVCRRLKELEREGMLERRMERLPLGLQRRGTSVRVAYRRI